MDKLKILAIVGLIVVVILSVAGFWTMGQIKQREALKDAQISVEDLNLRSIGNINNQAFDIRFKIYNPDNITATVDNMTFDLYANNIYIGNGSIDSRTDIPPKNSKDIVANFNLATGDSIQTMASVIELKKVDLKIKGIIRIDLIIMTIQIPFQYEIAKSV